MILIVALLFLIPNICSKTFRIARPGFVEAYGLLLVFSLVFIRGNIMGDPGLGWHLKQGELILNGFGIPRGDYFLLDGPTEWIDNQWLAEVIFAFCFKLGGWFALHFTCVFLFLITMLICIAPLIAASGVGVLATFFCLAIIGSCLSIQFIARPVLFSFLLFALLYRILWMFWLRQRTLILKDYLLVAFIFVLWSNVHPGFPLGIFMLGCFLLNASIEKVVSRGQGNADNKHSILNYAWLLVVAIGATLLNPYGVEIYKSIFALIGNNFFMHLHDEWLPVEFFRKDFFPFTLLLCLLAISLVTSPKAKFLVADFALALPLLYLSIKHRRYVPFFAIGVSRIFAISFQCLIDNLFRVRFRGAEQIFARINCLEKLTSKGGWSLIFLLISMAVLSSLDRSKLERFSPELSQLRQGVEFIAEKDPGARIFHTPNWGGFITFYGCPEVKPFIDDRNILNGEEKYRIFFTINNLEDGWEQLIDKFMFNWFLLEKASPLNVKLTASPVTAKHLGISKYLVNDFFVLYGTDRTQFGTRSAPN